MSDHDLVCDWTFQKAFVLCFAVSVAYVLFLYILVPAEVRALDRSHPTQIKHRLLAVTIAKAVSFAVAYIVIPAKACLGASLWQLFGFSNLFEVKTWLSLVITVALMAIFYLGELIGNFRMFFFYWYYEKKRSSVTNTITFVLRDKPPSFAKHFSDEIQYHLTFLQSEPIATFRNICFAPISEELVFRSIIVSALYTAYFAQRHELFLASSAEVSLHTAWMSIGWFGIAHAHHLSTKIAAGEPLSTAVLGTVFQLLYTSIFGFIAAMFLLRTGNIYTAILSHMICNYVGLPDMGFLAELHPFQRMTCNYPFRYVLLALHGAGLVLFYLAFGPLTASLAESSIYYR